MTKALFIVSALLLSATLFAQDVASETFTYHYSPKRAQVAFVGKSHYFTLKLKGRKISLPELQGAADDNQHFLTVDGSIFQMATIALPADFAAESNQKISNARQLELLTSYVNYEMEYVRDELHVAYSNLNMTPANKDDRSIIVWTYDMPVQENMDGLTITQCSISTICFNQVLTLGSPLMKDETLGDKLNLLLTVAESIRMSDGAFRE